MNFFAKKGDFLILKEGISTVETISIGGINQSILIQGENIDNPILLFLHGGPSMPIPGVSCRAKDYTIATTTKELVKHFVVVFWDQRGTGKSYHSDIPKESIHVSQYVSDAKEVVYYLRKHFNKDKIFLAGHSWGTVIGLRLASEIPSNFYAYVGISQIINWVENDRLCLKWALNKAREKGNKKAILELEKVGVPPYVESFKQWGVLRKWLMKFKSTTYMDNNVKPPGLIEALKIVLRSPDYTLKDIFHSFYSGFILSYSQKMVEDFAQIDFIKTAPKIEIPIFFIHGRKDVHVYGELVEEYFNKLETPNGKYLFWVDKSSHMFHLDDAREIESILIEKVRKKAWELRS